MQAKVDGIYEFTGLREFADLPLKYYSSGMYMRLAFAIATEVDPDILLIDESLGAGDAAFVDKAKARILGLLDRSNVVVIVSHDLDAAPRDVHPRDLDEEGPGRRRRADRRGDRPLPRGRRRAADAGLTGGGRTGRGRLGLDRIGRRARMMSRPESRSGPSRSA